LYPRVSIRRLNSLWFLKCTCPFMTLYSTS
jgi:hypothetical protein